MTQTIQFDGKQHSFPDDFTPADISTALGSLPPADSAIVGGVKQLGVGVGKGLIGLAGMAGDIPQLAAAGYQKAFGGPTGAPARPTIPPAYTEPETDAARLDYSHWALSPEAIAQRAKVAATPVASQAPTGGGEAVPSSVTIPGSREIQGAIEAATGPFRKPQNVGEEYAQTVGEFAPGALGGPGGIARRFAGQVLAPAITSETAGQVAHTYAPAAEIPARIIGGLAGGVIGARATAGRAAAAPAAEEIRDASRQAYQEMRASNVELHPQPVANVAHQIEQALTQEGLTARNVPETYGVLRTLQNPPRGSVMRAVDFENARQELVAARQNVANRREAVAANRAIDQLDTYLANVPASHVASGDVAAFRDAAQRARGNWAAASRADTVGGKIELGDLNAATAHSGQNIDNATRQAIKQLIRPDKNGRTLAERMGYSAAEIDAMNRVARGTFTGNVARFLGKLAPTNLIAVGMHGAAAGASGGMSLPLSAAAYMAKRVGDASTARSTARLDELVRSRSPLGQATGAGILPPSLGVGAGGLLGGLLAVPQQRGLLPYDPVYR